MTETINDEILTELAEFHNKNGKKEMYRYGREVYKIKNMSALFHRMCNKDSLGYDKENNVFRLQQIKNEDKVFISLEELCTPPAVRKTEPKVYEERSIAMEKLVHDLVENRLLEVSKYVTINSYSKQLILDRTLLLQEGYQVIIQ